MGLATWFKVQGIKAADVFYAKSNPYKQFTRPQLRITTKKLEVMESECLADLSAFMFFDEIIAHRIPLDTNNLDTGDQALWQGINATALAFNYARTKSDKIATLLMVCMKGMYQHQWIHGEKDGRLIRGYDRNQKTATGVFWQDDASNDSLTGHFAGLYFVFKYGPDDLKSSALSLLRSLAASIIEHDLNLVKADGTPTTHGRLISGITTDPLQMTLVLGILTVAERYDLHPQASQKRAEVYNAYGAMIPYGKVMLTQLDNFNDEHRAAIHLLILAMEDKSPRMRELTQAGAWRLWRITQNRANVWVNALISLIIKENGLTYPDEMRYQANFVLQEFDLESTRFDLALDYTKTPVVDYERDAWSPQLITVNNIVRSNQPLPLWAIGRQDFPWQRNRFTVKDWADHQQPTQRFNGMSFLAPYWASQLAGLL